MNDLMVAPKEAIEDVMLEVGALTTEELRAQLVISLRVTAAQLVRLAGIVRTLEERGENLDDFRGALPTYLRKIAYGQLLPEVVVRFSEARGLLHRISQLPLPEQKRLAAGESVRVAVPKDDGSLDYRLIDPLALRGPLVGQVFGPDRIRGADEQAAIIEARRAMPAPKTQPKQRVRVDRDRGGIMVGRQFASVAEVLSALATLNGSADIPDETAAEGRQPIILQINEDEHRQLKILAAKNDTTMTTLVRRALAAHGLIGRKETNDA